MSDRNTSHIHYQTSTFRQREPREAQFFTRENNNSDTPLYSLEAVHSCDWRLFVWLASLVRVEAYIHLFVVVWDSTSLHNNTQEFFDETDKMIQFINDLTNLKAFNVNVGETHHKTLEDYRNFRLSNKDDARKNLVHNIWIELEEKHGLKQFSYAFGDQLNRLPSELKTYLKKIIFARMTSSCSVAKKVFSDCEAEKQEKQQSLMRQVETLVRENSRQQASLGNLTDVSWDEEKPGKLNSDIEDLQDMLSDFTMVQGNDYRINDLNATFLLKTNQCQVRYPSPEANLVLGALLQRYTTNYVLEEVQSYFKRFRSSVVDSALECNIVDTTDRLIKYMKSLNDNRDGDDDIAKFVPIKIRQNVYSALSCRGFSNEHSFIKETANKLLEEMNKFREVVDEDTNDGLYEQAIQITCRVIDIFCFRLKTQASEPTYRFFRAGDDVDPRVMQGTFKGQDAKKLEVEVCGFPFIGMLENDNSNFKVFTKAQVITRSKKI